MSDPVTRSGAFVDDEAGPLAGSAEPTHRQRVVALVVVGVILLAAGVGLQAAVSALKLSFQKEAVPLRSALLTIPSQIGPWMQVNRDEPMPAEIEAELGTKQYIQRMYVDTRVADESLQRRLETMDEMSQEERATLRQELAANVSNKDPFSVVTLHVAYYTGGVDTVPHIPERCMVAGGYDPVGREQADLDLGERVVPASFVQFQQKAGHTRPKTLSVAYFFHVNGVYEWDAITGVRMRLQNLFETRAYFAKIECMAVAGQPDQAPAQAAIERFMAEALPEIERCLPVWESTPDPSGEPSDAGGEIALNQ